MRFLYILLAFSIHSCLSVESAVSANEDQLIFANVIHRHGDRNILSSFPEDPWKNESYWPGGYGALTLIGKQQGFELGQFLRKRYGKLIGTSYSPNRVYIRSTNTDRTLMTAQCVAAGLFPPSKDEIWNKTFNLWQPIPIHTVPIEQDHFLITLTKCPRYVNLLEQQMKSSELAAIANQHKTLLEFLEKNSKMKVRTVANVLFIYDTIRVEKLKGFELPDWVVEALEFNKTLEYLSAVCFKASTHSEEMKKLKTGYFLKEMLNHFKAKISSTLKPDRSLWIYSAHDATIISILNGLNVYDMTIPPYVSSLHLELYKRGTEYYVQLYYRKNGFENISAIEIPHCGTKCPLDRFYELYKNILPTEDIESACRE